MNLSVGREHIPFYRWRGWPYKCEGESTYASKPCCPRRRVQDNGRRPQHCWMSDARGRLCCLLRVWQTSAPATLLIPRGVQGVLPCSLSQNRPIYKSTSTMAARKRSHCHTWAHINPVVYRVPRRVLINDPQTTKIVHDSTYTSHVIYSSQIQIIHQSTK